MKAHTIVSRLRQHKIALIAALCLSLASCTLLLGPQAALINALFEKFVGVSPLSAQIFEHPLIKGRMQELLGDYYGPTVQLLNTASAIQKEGPLYYVISRYTPLPEFADKAGFVYNTDSNQMLVMILKGESKKVLFETVDKAAKKVMPPLPKEMQLLMNPQKAVENAVDQAAGAAAETMGVDPALLDSLRNTDNPEALKKMAEEAVKSQAGSAAQPATTTP